MAALFSLAYPALASGCSTDICLRLGKLLNVGRPGGDASCNPGRQVVQEA